MFRKFLVILVALSLFLTACGPTASGGTTPLEASGVIEATETVISAELSGRVVEVLVDEGDTVRAGDVLFRLDDSLLQEQRRLATATLDSARAAQTTAQANLELAQAQYEAALAAARAEEQQARIADWRYPNPDYFDQPAWYFTREEQIASAQAEVEAARAALDEARQNLEQVLADLGNADFLQAEKRLSDARIAYLVAREVYSRSQAGDDTDLIDAARNAFNDAKDELQRAQEDYNDLLTTQAADDVLTARAELAVAQERYEAALDRLQTLQTGAYSPQVVAAQKAVQVAQASLRQAESAVAQAEAQLSLLDAQIEKLTVRAPLDGVVLTRSIQPGEIIQAGMAAMTIAQLDQLTVTVYIPENRYGEIHLGDHASLTVDSFPGETFDAVVTRISDRAEYTPRNVQTKEERQTTVYAVELAIENPQGKLKPGMPADVLFEK